MKLVTVQTFDNPIDLHLLKSKLENEGIHCFIFDEHTVTINPILSQGIGGIRLKIAEIDSEKALVILQQIQKEATLEVDGSDKLCPRCGSIDLYVNFRSMKGVKGILSMITMFAFVIFPIYYRNVCKCKKCNFEFK